MEKNDLTNSMEALFNAVSHLITLTEKMRDDVEAMKKSNQQQNAEWLSLEQLIDYLPTHPTARTVYGWVKNDKIPYHKLMGSLVFKREEIDVWIINGQPEILNYL